MKMKNLKVFVSSVMAAVTMGNGMVISADAKSSNKEESYVYVYNDKKDLNKDYKIDEPIELIIPISAKVSKDGSQSYQYGTIIVENDKASINPTEIVNVMEAMQTLNKKNAASEFVYVDGNATENDNFKINTSTKKYIKKELMNYISKQNENIEKSKKNIAHSKYAEFILPVMGNYKYKNANGKTAIYRQVEYIYFYMPYDQITNSTNFSNLATLVYERYQNSFDHVVTYNELKKEDSKHKEPILAKIK